MIKRILFVLFGLIFLAGIAFVGNALLGQERVSRIDRETSEQDNKDVAVLILGKVGVGQGGQWHAAPNLVDTIVLTYFQEDTNTANLISLPRDLYGEVGGDNIKLTHLVTENKIEDFLGILPSITGVNTDKYVVIELGVFEAIVDGLGGIDVDLPERVTDPITKFTLDAGPQRLNGEDAAWLIRNRYAPEGDFFREKNQHLVVEAIFKKFNSLSSIRKTAFAFRLLPSIRDSQTNFSIGEFIYEFADAKDVSFQSIVLDFGTELLTSDSIETPGGEVYILVPKEGVNRYSKIREFIESKIL